MADCQFFELHKFQMKVNLKNHDRQKSEISTQKN